MAGPWEWILIGLIALLIFGPAMFIRAGSSLGAGVGAFKKAVKAGESQNQPGAPEPPAGS